VDLGTEPAATSKGSRMFSENEIQYLKSQRLARIATASVSSEKEDKKEFIQPDIAPVGFDFDGEYLYVGGMNILKSTKYKNVLKNNKVATVIDDLESEDPRYARAIKIYGTAEIITRQSVHGVRRVEKEFQQYFG
jgi:pyridoxamine 5'-phosphate oxidase family protein